MKKNDLSALQENCFCFCDEEISREAPFQVPIDIPEGFKVDTAEASAAVTWSTDNLSCISEPCLIQTGPEPEDIGVRYAVRVQGGQLVESIIDTFEFPSLIATPYAGNFAYVLNGELLPKGVTEISLSPLSRGGDFNRLFETLRTIVFSRDSTRAYFLEPYSEPFLINNLYVVNTAGQRIIANVSLPGAFDLAVTPDNQYIYAAQPGDNTVTVYRTSDYTAMTVIPVGTGPSAIAM